MPASKRAQQSRHSAQDTPAVAATAPSSSAAAATTPVPISISTTAAAPTSRIPQMPAPTSGKTPQEFVAQLNMVWSIVYDSFAALYVDPVVS
ncbi:hypothetical protein C8R44DRAFT_989593, partial [Mycena epipterygia]